MTWQSPELKQLFGVPIDREHVTEGVLRDLLGRVHETEQLDFKGDLDRPTVKREKRKAQQEFAKDVAAFANARGGLIVVGVTQDDDGCAKGLNRQKISPDGEARRLGDALLNFVSPFIDVEYIPVRSSEPDSWYLLIVVPPSRRLPHAVGVLPGELPKKLWYPLRAGLKTAELSESGCR